MPLGGCSALARSALLPFACLGVPVLSEGRLSQGFPCLVSPTDLCTNYVSWYTRICLSGLSLSGSDPLVS